MKKLLAIDMDGTCLTNGKKITEKTMQALKKAADNGIIIVPTTGRPLDSLPRQLLAENFYRYVITSNEARISDVKENKTLYSSLIPLKNGISLLMEGKKRGLGLTAHVDNHNIVEGAILSLKGRLVYKKDTVDAIKTKDIIQTVKEMNGDLEEVQFFFFNEKKKWWAKDIVGKNRDFAATFGHNYVEMYNKDVSKGAAISKLAEILGVAKENIICIGDGENDLSMFESAGIKIAMGNAEVALKNKADFVLATNNKDGVVEAIEKIL